jgi:small subunit ribosomal protein S5
VAIDTNRGRGGQSGGGDSSSRGGRGQGDRGGRQQGGRQQGGESNRGELIDKVVKIKRCAAVVKGGRRFSFAAMVVVGNGRGKVGWGYGKANEVQPSVEKAVKEGSRSMFEINVDGGSIPHRVEGFYGSAHVVLVPAAPGTGVIAGSAVRAVCEAAGIQNILTKSFGSNNPTNLVKATLEALQQLRTLQDIERLRGVTLS